MSRLLFHRGDPAVASNLEVEQDLAGNLKPNKDRSTERINCILALVIALHRAITGGPGGSVY